METVRKLCTGHVQSNVYTLVRQKVDGKQMLCSIQHVWISGKASLELWAVKVRVDCSVVRGIVSNRLGFGFLSPIHTPHMVYCTIHYTSWRTQQNYHHVTVDKEQTSETVCRHITCSAVLPSLRSPAKQNTKLSPSSTQSTHCLHKSYKDIFYISTWQNKQE